MDQQPTLFKDDYIFFLEIRDEIERQEKAGRFPIHIASQAGQVVSAAGTVMKEALHRKYDDKKFLGNESVEALARKETIHQALVQTAAACVRMMKNFK